MGTVVMTLWVIVLGITIGGFFVGLGAGLAKFVMWLKGE